MAKNNSKEINFQQYINGVKQQKISWHFFINVMEDLTYLDITRLRNLNALLLIELTMNKSDIDKMKYLNGILLIQFKNLLQTKYNFEITENECLESSQEPNVDQVLNEEEILKNDDAQITENYNFESLL